jgi:hypothetical protein
MLLIVEHKRICYIFYFFVNLSYIKIMGEISVFLLSGLSMTWLTGYPTSRFNSSNTKFLHEKKEFISQNVGRVLRNTKHIEYEIISAPEKKYV